MGSGHIDAFDRRKCKGPLDGPNATGDHCPEGWPFHQYPGPGFKGIGDNSAESSYYTWVDQHNTLGLRTHRSAVPVSAGSAGQVIRPSRPSICRPARPGLVGPPGQPD